MARVTGKQTKNSGDIYESIIRSALYRLGFEMIDKIANVWKPIKVTPAAGGLLRGTFAPVKVRGDYTAIDPQTGKKVLIEVKGRQDRLGVGALADHQIEALNENAQFGGISLLAWVDTGSPNLEIYIMRWPIDGFKKGKPIKPDQACDLCIIPR